MELPAADTLLLATQNAHDRDDRIRFDPITHKYFVDGARYPSSVSGLIHDFFPQFDATKVIDQYYNSWKNNKENKYNPLIQYLTGIVGLNDEMAKREIARNWSQAGNRASTQGTDTHLQIELCLNKEPHMMETPEFKQYEAWRKTHPTWQPYRTEWSIFSEPELVCGQLDSLWVDEHGKFHMRAGGAAFSSHIFTLPRAASAKAALSSLSAVVSPTSALRSDALPCSTSTAPPPYI